MFSCECSEILMKTCFEDHLRRTPSKVWVKYFPLHKICENTRFRWHVFFRIGTESAIIPENTGQWKRIFSHILCSILYICVKSWRMETFLKRFTIKKAFKPIYIYLFIYLFFFWGGVVFHILKIDIEQTINHSQKHNPSLLKNDVLSSDLFRTNQNILQ